ncbi:PTS transporter subunit EIIC [Pluralibacter sp.]|jgi:glucose-like phosphotransferase system IIB component|uniref:PTS transporter subunit EIIC n=1 Tax=Pluralibacter sp. TaxID=1920032 RepID=UPI0025D528C9|nr:PTS transporter subunit EIIC [Pluralibacter sp.]MBV8043985.1 PTS transporter subunit EIIC [Pluralibacter sp.]
MNKVLLGKLQFFAKSMLYAATFVLPFAAMMIAIGSVGMNESLLGGVPVIGSFFSFMGKYMNLAGWVILGNLPFFFALCVAAALTKEKQAGVVVIAGLFFLTFNKLLGELSLVYFSHFKDVAGLVTATDLLSPEKNPNYHVLFESVFGVVTMRVGVVGAIIVGALSAHLWEKFKNFERLPMWLDFFNGQRFTVLVTFFYALALALVVMVVWPIIGTGLDHLARAVENSGAFYVPFVKTLLEVGLRTIGMHHITNYVFEYTPVGGTLYSTLQQVNLIGVAQVCPARLDEIVNLVNQGQPAMAQRVFDTPNMCNIYYAQDITGLFALPGAAIGMFFSIPKEKRTKKVKALYISTATAVIFTGFAEPLEFMFVLVSPILYGVHVLMLSTFAMIPDLLSTLFGEQIFTWKLFGLVNVVASGILQVGGVLGRWWELALWFVIGLGITTVYAAVFRYLIVKFDITVLGREPDGETDEPAKESALSNLVSSDESKFARIVEALGGKENIISVGNCFTRLRIEVKDHQIVNSDKKLWMKLGAMEVVVLEGGVQAIYGASVDRLRIKLEDYIATQG